MNNEDWKRVEKDLSTPLEIVKLEIDGYKEQACGGGFK